MRRADALIGVGLLLFAALYFQQSFAIVTGFASDRLGPAFFPRLLAIALAACALALIWRAAFARREEEPLRPVRAALLAIVVGLTVAYALVLPTAGFLVATPVYLAAIIWLLGYTNPVGLVGASLGVTAALYLVFARGLHVLLPRGLL